MVRPTAPEASGNEWWTPEPERRSLHQESKGASGKREDHQRLSALSVSSLPTRQDALGESPATICGQDKFPGIVVSEAFSRWVYTAPGTYFKFGPFQACTERTSGSA